MKRFIVVFGSMIFMSCSSPSMGPISVNSGTIVPPDKSIFDYSLQNADPAVLLTEQVTIKDASSSKFVASLISDTLANFFTTSTDSFTVMTNGDLLPLSNSDTLPISSRKTYSEIPISIPVKLNGEVGTGTINTGIFYIGQETISAANENFICEKVKVIDTVSMVYPSQPSMNSNSIYAFIYWYSTKLGYFVEAQEIDSISNVFWTRILTSYTLGH
jgi:hypothetical protein